MIHPDQSTKQMMENEMNVSNAKKSPGLFSIRPTCAMEQYSMGDERPER